MQKQRCENCRYFCDEAPFFECRKHPPSTIWTQASCTQISIWPRIHKDDWCGEWKEQDTPTKPEKATRYEGMTMGATDE